MFSGPVAQRQEQSPHKGKVAGSAPARPTKKIFRGVAQGYERLAWDQEAAGSIPVTPTNTGNVRSVGARRCENGAKRST